MTDPTRPDPRAPLDLLVQEVSARLRELLLGADDRAPPVCGLHSPEQIGRALAQAGLPLPLRPDDPLPDLPALTRALDAVAAHSVRTLHPRFLNQNFAGADPIAILGDWFGAAYNTTLATYEAAPVFTLIERALIARLAELVGWSAHEGLFVAGGSLSNLYAMHLARARSDPDSLEYGPSLRSDDKPPLIAFTSAHSHYSLTKSAVLLGLGRRALRLVPCDDHGRMRPKDLAALIHEAADAGQRPFFVNATAGTTVLGAFDPFWEIADLCAQHGLWLHIDGTFGASALLSPRQRWRLDGAARADSLSWNLHKMLGITQHCAALLVRRPGQLRPAFAASADYLFQPDKPHAELDSGDLTFQCARRNDVFKAWFCWKARGEAALAARVDHGVELAALAARRIESDPRFALAAPPSWVNVCFWWVPPHLRPLDRTHPEFHAHLHPIAPAIKARLLAEGAVMLAYQPIGPAPNAFRLLFINPAVTPADIDHTLDAIDRHGRALFA